MDSIWFYTMDGKPAYYQIENNIYTTGGAFAYFENNDWWFNAKSGEASYYIVENWLYTKDGMPALYRT